MRRPACLVAVVLVCALGCRVGPTYERTAVVELRAGAMVLENVGKQLRNICEPRTLLESSAVWRGVLNKEQTELARALLPRSAVSVLVDDVLMRIMSGASDSARPYARLLRKDAVNETTGKRIAGFYARFRTLDELMARWRWLRDTYVGAVRMETYGMSVQGRPLHMLRVGNTPAERPVRVLVQGLQHAREWVTAMAASYIAEQLVVDGMPRGVEVIVVVMANPDGFLHSATHDRLWRKNLSKQSSCGLNEGASGVDLNRNWGVDFGGSQSSSSDACSDVHCGRDAFSEPETASLRALVNRLPGLSAHLDIHAFGQLVVGPWLHSAAPPRAAALVDKVGLSLARALSDEGARYAYGRGARNGLYLASGTASDWFFAHGILSYTIELRPDLSDPLGFILREEQILPTCRDALRGVRALVSFAIDNFTLRSSEPVPSPVHSVHSGAAADPMNSAVPVIAPLIVIAAAGLVVSIVLAGVTVIVQCKRRNDISNSTSLSSG